MSLNNVDKRQFLLLELHVGPWVVGIAGEFGSVGNGILHGVAA